MGATDNLKNEVIGFGVLLVVIITMSILFTTITNENINNVICPGTGNSTHLYYNTTSGACCLGTSTTATNCLGTNTTAISGVGTAINTAKDAIRSPVTWFSIIVLLVVIRWVMKYLGKKNEAM